MLTPDAGKRAERALAAAEVMYEAGAYDAVENLLLGTRQARTSTSFRPHVPKASPRRSPCPSAATRTTRSSGSSPRANGSPTSIPGSRTWLTWKRFGGLSTFRTPNVLSAVADALNRSPASESGAIVELILRGWAQMLEQGYPAGADLLREAVFALREKPQLEESDLPVVYFSDGIARSTWDVDSWETLTRRGVQLARDAGALSMLPKVLHSWANVKVALGEFPAAAIAYAEAEAVANATRAGAEDSAWFDAWQLDEPDALRRIDLHERIEAFGGTYFFDYARALVYNAAGRYELALEAAQRSCDRNPVGTYTWALVELIEAATRCGQEERANVAFEQLADRTRLASTEWALGLEARSAAHVNDDPAVAEPLYLSAIERLGRARTRPDLARAHLVYGEWLRRENRRLDARQQLRLAHDMFSEMGVSGFAERARRELAGTGETARKRTDDTRGDLTAQESQIAQLASEGLTNPEIGAKLFLSPRTIEWHLRRVYPKLGVSSRKELRAVLGVS